ncbi:type I-E CRISPR-associated protein Cse2/CasB [Salana multivorans]
MNETNENTDTEVPPGAAETSPARGTRRRTHLGHKVAHHIETLQRRSNEDVAGAVRTMAILRRAATAHPGTVPDVWVDTIELVPADAYDRRRDEPSAAELAAHHAVTLFAMHRQGRVKHAHAPGVAPGRAFARLARKRGESEGDKGVRRRFDAMVTAPTAEESVRHLRGLVQLLRAEDLGLDYGLLAEDLADLWSVSNQDRARLRWARQYSGLPPSSADSAEDGDAAITTNTSNDSNPTSEESA